MINERELEIQRLKSTMKEWNADRFRKEYALIKEKLGGGSDLGQLEYSKQATTLMIKWQAIREFLEEKLCISKPQ